MKQPYSNELYDTIVELGLRHGASILDVGSDDGAAGAPFAQNGFDVAIAADAEQLPFPDERFDAVLCAQSIHRYDRERALPEMIRVLKHGGIIAIWWKQLMAHDGVTEIRDVAYRAARLEIPTDGLTGGFKEFYGASDLKEQRVRVIPWRRPMSVDDFTGELAPAARRHVASELSARLPSPTALVDVPYVQYLYTAARR